MFYTYAANNHDYYSTGELDKKMPVRFIYSGSEQTLNGDNYKQAVVHQDTDNLLTKI